MSKGMEGGVSRRSFLKGAGVAAAAVAGSAALAGCASGSTGAASGDWLPKSWDYECDLLVIGYGGAGMWASLIGADECGQEVIVLEKAPVEGGGNSRINNGEWTIVEESDKERFKKYIKAFTHGKTPRADDRRLGQRVRSQHRVRRQVRHDLRGVRGRAGRRHPRVLLPGRQRLRGLLQAVLRRRLRHAVVPRARRAAREAGRAGSVRLPRRASHPEPRDQGDRRRVHDDRLRGEDGQGSQGRHHDHGRLRVQRGSQERLPQVLPLQVRGLAVQHGRRHQDGRGRGSEAVAHGHGDLHVLHVDARS